MATRTLPPTYITGTEAVDVHDLRGSTYKGSSAKRIDTAVASSLVHRIIWFPLFSQFWRQQGASTLSLSLFFLAYAGQALAVVLFAIELRLQEHHGARCILGLALEVGQPIVLLLLFSFLWSRMNAVRFPNLSGARKRAATGGVHGGDSASAAHAVPRQPFEALGASDAITTTARQPPPSESLSDASETEEEEGDDGDDDDDGASSADDEAGQEIDGEVEEEEDVADDAALGVDAGAPRNGGIFAGAALSDVGLHTSSDSAAACLVLEGRGSNTSEMDAASASSVPAAGAGDLPAGCETTGRASSAAASSPHPPSTAQGRTATRRRHPGSSSSSSGGGGRASERSSPVAELEPAAANHHQHRQRSGIGATRLSIDDSRGERSGVTPTHDGAAAGGEMMSEIELELHEILRGHHTLGGGVRSMSLREAGGADLADTSHERAIHPASRQAGNSASGAAPTGRGGVPGRTHSRSRLRTDDGGVGAVAAHSSPTHASAASWQSKLRRQFNSSASLSGLVHADDGAGTEGPVAHVSAPGSQSLGKVSGGKLRNLLLSSSLAGLSPPTAAAAAVVESLPRGMGSPAAAGDARYSAGGDVTEQAGVEGRESGEGERGSPHGVGNGAKERELVSQSNLASSTGEDAGAACHASAFVGAAGMLPDYSASSQDEPVPSRSTTAPREQPEHHRAAGNGPGVTAATMTADAAAVPLNHHRVVHTGELPFTPLGSGPSRSTPSPRYRVPAAESPPPPPPPPQQQHPEAPQGGSFVEFTINATTWDPRTDAPVKRAVSLAGLASVVVARVSETLRKDQTRSAYRRLCNVAGVLLAATPIGVRACMAAWSLLTEGWYGGEGDLSNLPFALLAALGGPRHLLISLLCGCATAVVGSAFFRCIAHAEEAYHGRLLLSKYFSSLTSAARARRHRLPHFRLHKITNLRMWLSLRSLLRRRGSRRTVDAAVSMCFVMAICLVTALVSLQSQRSASSSVPSGVPTGVAPIAPVAAAGFPNGPNSSPVCTDEGLTSLAWLVLAYTLLTCYYLLRFLTLSNAVQEKHASTAILLTEQINLTLRAMSKPSRKEELAATSNVLKLATKLLRELESPKRASGFALSPTLVHATRIVVLSAVSALVSDLLGFKLRFKVSS